MKPSIFTPSPVAAALARWRVFPSIVVTGLALLSAQPAGAVMMDLTNTISFNTLDLLGNGDVFGSKASGTGVEVFRWNANDGVVSLGVMSGASPEIRAVNRDGSFIGGNTAFTTSAGTVNHAFRWTAAGGFTDLGTLGGARSFTNAFNRDGSVVVGASDRAMGAGHAFRWTAAGGMQDLGSLSQDGYSSAIAVSSDGAVVVGFSYADVSNSIIHAFRWDSATGSMADLGALAGNRSSQAWAVSDDGSVVVGDSSGAAGLYGFRWTKASGMQSLGTLAGFETSNARDVSADGSVVVGFANSSSTRRAVRWSAATGIADLGVLTGETKSFATKVSDDGRTVLGTSGLRTFIWTSDDNTPAIPGTGPGGAGTGTDTGTGDTGTGTGTGTAPVAGGGTATSIPATVIQPAQPRQSAGGVLQDLRNLQVSVIRSADTAAQLTSNQARRLRDLSQQACIPGAAQAYCLSVGAAGYKGEADNDASQRIGQLGGGLRLNEQFALGGTLSLAQVDLEQNAAKQRNAYGVNLWVAYQQNSASAQGWNANASVAVGSGNNRFDRGTDLLDVQKAATDVRITSAAQRIALGYGIALGSTLLTPEIALSHVRSARQAFQEKDVALPLHVNGASSDENYATFTLRSATPLGPKASLLLSVAADALLNDDTPGFEGSSSIPGFARFALDSSLEKRNVVPVATAQYSYALSPQATVAAGMQAAASVYQGERPVYGLGVQYRYAF